MPEEQLNAFIEKVKADNSLLEKLKEASSPEAVLEIAKHAGFSITAEDIQSVQSKSGEVSDGELEGATGGRARIGTSPDAHREPFHEFPDRTVDVIKRAYDRGFNLLHNSSNAD